MVIPEYELDENSLTPFKREAVVMMLNRGLIEDRKSGTASNQRFLMIVLEDGSDLLLFISESIHQPL